jgi:hypothetical protein
MSRLWDLDLIRFFEFYLALIFALNTVLRLRQYFAVLALLRAMPARWPHLMQLIRRQHGIFLTWETFASTLLALALLLVYEAAIHLVWPHARLTVAGLFTLWLAVPVVLVTGVAMLAVDGYCAFNVGKIDQAETEKYFDQAEYWLRSWTGHVVRVFTFGYVDPRQMVSVEVSKALLELRRMLHTTMWWVSLQTGVRIAFGLAVWLTWAFSQSATA